jgi:transcriptional regulator with GAF, ATPase, and Fis domain
MSRRRFFGAETLPMPFSFNPGNPHGRRAALITAGALVCLYSILVLLYAHSVREVGFRTAFDPVVRGFEGEFLALPSGQPLVPQPGDRLVKLGDREIDTWAQFIQVVRDLPSSAAKVQDPREAADTGQTYVCFEGKNWILSELVRQQTDGRRIKFSGWSRVGTLPLKELIPSILWFFLKLGLFAVAVLVFWKRPTDVSATLFYVLGVVTLGAFMGGYHWSRIAGYPPLILVFMLCAVVLPAVLLHFYFVFPSPKPILQRRPIWTLCGIYAVPLGFLAALFWSYFRARAGSTSEDVNQSLSFLLYEIYWYLGVAAVWYLACVFCLIHSYRMARDEMELNQVKWILVGSLAASAPIGYTLYLAAFRPDDFGAGGATWWMFGASVCFTIAFAIAITRYRLMRLDQIINSGMIYFAVSFGLGLIYYVLLLCITMVIGRGTDLSLSQPLTVSTTALVLMILLNVVRKKALDWRFYREKFLLDRTLRRMGQAIEQLVDPPTLARQLLQAASEVLNVSRGAVYLREGEPPLYRLVESLGAPPPLTELSPGCPLIEIMQRQNTIDAVAGRGENLDSAQRQLGFLGGEIGHALVHEDQLLALLILGPKGLGPYSAEDLNLLAALCQLAALALKSAERHQTIEGLNKEIQAKVEKISEQQRRILALQTQLMRHAAPTESTDANSPGMPGGIVGSSPVVQQLTQFVKKVSGSQSSVLIRGESGTGKELLARALHEASPRASKAFMKVHCAALSPGLLESELFGHVKGAFTGAHKDKAGRFEVADGGTLFLDEIGDISLDIQTKLLRVLQEKTFERVGSSDSLRVDVRVIAATHQNLERLIAEGRFREDLYYRLNVISVAVPPLRERCEDIPELAAHFLKDHSQRSCKVVTGIDDDALALLKAYRWPGNIRQLENVIERGVVVADGSLITVDELPVELVREVDDQVDRIPETANGHARSEGSASAGIQTEREERGRRERERLVRALAAAKGNKAEAARALGLARSTLISRLKKYGLN